MSTNRGTAARPLSFSRRGVAVMSCLVVAMGSALTATAHPARAVTGFTAGDVVVYRVGSGSTTLSTSSAPVFLDEYTPAGALVQSVALPTSASGSNKPLVASGTASSEGELTLSSNGSYLVATGYDTTAGQPDPSAVASTSVPRTIALVNGSDAINSTTALTDVASKNNIRSATSDNGTNVWVGSADGSSGIRYAAVGATTSTAILTSTYKNGRQVSIANGQLYVSADPTKAGLTVAQVGTGLPTSGSLTPTNLNFSAAPVEPYAYSFVTLGSGTAPDTLYVADNTAGAVLKYSLVSGSWVAKGSVAVAGVTGVTANDTNGIVSIFATANGTGSAAGTLGTLDSITDSSGAGGTLSGSATVLGTAASNETFRGVAFAPGTTFGSGGPPPPVLPTIALTHTGLPAAINDPTNPTDSVAIADPKYPDASQLTMTASSSNPAVAPAAGISIQGTGATRTIQVTPGNTVGYSNLTLTVTAPDGQTAQTVLVYGLSADLGDPSDRYFSGAGNLSTAIDVGGGYMVVGDDESNILRLYNETQSGPPVKTFDFTSRLPSGTTEVDIEASARAGNTLFWSGSMSNSSSGKLEPARSTLFAATITGSGASTSLTYVGAYSGLQTDLVNWDETNGSGLGANALGFNQAVNGGAVNHATDSLELEGMEFAAGSSSTAYLAFRGPIEPASNPQDALVIPLTNINGLVSGTATQASFGPPLLWNLGGLGIRELRANADGTYLLIAGTADGSNSSFVLYTWDGKPSDPPLPTNTALPLIPSGANQGSWETIVSVPDPLTSGAGVQLVEDNGDTAWYGDTATSKDTLPTDLQKDLGRVFTYSPPTPNSVVITAANASRPYGQPDPTFTYSATGLSGSDTVTTAPTCGVAGTDSAVGTYPITCSGAATSGANDAISYVAGTLTVTKAAVTVFVGADADPVATGQPVTFSATVSPGPATSGAVPSGTVEFAAAGTDLPGCAAVSLDASGSATCPDQGDLPLGEDTVTATYSGDGDFSADTGTVTETVNPASYLFVDENPAGPNEVLNYRVNPDGTTTLVGTYSTGHPGSDRTWVAASRGALASTTNHLYALNLGDQTVSVFEVDPTTGQLTLQETTGPLDASVIAVNPAGTVLYAGGSGNASTAPQLTSYIINPDGSIDTSPVQNVSAEVDGLTVSPDGTEVAAAYPGTGPADPDVQVWTTDGQGVLTAQASIDEPCPTDVRFTSDTTLVSASCYSGDLNSFSIGSGALTVTGSEPAASQTVALGADGSTFFETADGLQGTSSPALTPGATTAYPVDDTIASMSVTPDESRLFVASVFDTTINDYGIGTDDALTRLGTITVPDAGVPTVIAYTPTDPSGQQSMTTRTGRTVTPGARTLRAAHHRTGTPPASTAARTGRRLARSRITTFCTAPDRARRWTARSGPGLAREDRTATPARVVSPLT